MRLFKMEIYKLYHEKVFLWGVLSVIGLMMIFFWFAEVGDELAVIGEKSYSGYEAVQVNRKITKEFEGIEYYGTAEPPVRCGESHLSGLTEPLHFVY